VFTGGSTEYLSPFIYQLHEICNRFPYGLSRAARCGRVHGMDIDDRCQNSQMPK
jgi:hypothetical protein